LLLPLPKLEVPYIFCFGSIAFCTSQISIHITTEQNPDYFASFNKARAKKRYGSGYHGS
jgi:hypothetical protein